MSGLDPASTASAIVGTAVLPTLTRKFRLPVTGTVPALALAVTTQLPLALGPAVIAPEVLSMVIPAGSVYEATDKVGLEPVEESTEPPLVHVLEVSPDNGLGAVRVSC